MRRFAQQVRSLFDRQYRRAFRNLRHLPRMNYRRVIDAGAHRGAFTDAFLRLHRPERVVLVEAIPIDPRNSKWFGRDLTVASSISVPTMTLPELMTRENLENVDLLKLDLQGAERLVLTGGADALDRVRVIYAEVFFAPLYAGAWLFWEMNEFLSGRGFKLCGLSNIVHAADWDLVQANATFRRNDLV